MIHDVKVNADECIGCGGCEQTCSAIFRLTYKVHAEASGKKFEKHQKKMLAAYYGCPVQAIELMSDDPSLQIVWYPARVVEKTMLCDTVLEVRLATADLTYKPGQYITVRFKDDIGFFNRAYSIVDVRDGIVTLCITLLQGGRGSSAFAHYDIGGEVELTEPKGDFCLCETDRPKVFIGTGTGLIPLISMMEASPDAKKTLYFGQRKEGDLFYLDRMANIPNLEVKTCLDFADDDWAGLRGRVTEHFVEYPLTRETEIYTCGSDPMMNDLQSLLKKKRHPKELFFKESFSNINGANSKLDERGLLRRIWIRHLHVYASLLMSALFLFFGLSGFLASRPGLFASEQQRTLPENIAFEPNELSGYLKAKLPAGVALKGFSLQGEFAEIQFEDAEGGQFNVEVSLPDRSYSWVESYPLPLNSTSKTALELAKGLATQHSGKLDADSIEEDGDQIWINLESVWANTSIEVDRAQQRYEVRQDRTPWAAALVQLHRGKKSGPVQRVLIDLTAIFMVVATLTGIWMGVQSRNPVMRNLALILVGISIALTAVMIMNR